MPCKITTIVHTILAREDEAVLDPSFSPKLFFYHEDDEDEDEDDLQSAHYPCTSHAHGKITLSRRQKKKGNP